MLELWLQWSGTQYLDTRHLGAWCGGSGMPLRLEHSIWTPGHLGTWWLWNAFALVAKASQPPALVHKHSKMSEPPTWTPCHAHQLACLRDPYSSPYIGHVCMYSIQMRVGDWTDEDE